MSRSDLARLILSVLLLAALPLHLGAQDLDADFEEEFPDEDLPYVGLGAGLTATFIFMNIDELNALAESYEVDPFGGPLSVIGGGVILTPIYIPNVRVALHAYGGYHRSSRPRKFIAGTDSSIYNRTLRFGIRFQGMAGVDYAIPITRRLTMLPGIMAGWGSYALEFTQSESPEADFSLSWDPNRYLNDTAATMSHFNRSVRMLNYHAFISPSLHLEYAITGFLMVRASVGYRLGIIDDEWTNEANTVYTNVPEINANGPTAQVGVFVGLFQQ
jgi:hypothetical protein